MGKSRIWSGVRILSLLVFFALHPKIASADETIICDLSDTAGSAARLIATGWHGILSNEIPDSLFKPLRPSYFRGVTTAPDSFGTPEEQWIRANEMGATVIVELAGSFNGEGTWLGSWDTPAGFPAKLQDWIRHVHDWVNWTETFRRANGRNVTVHYEIWNEPDDNGSWLPNADSTHAASLFLELWHATSDSIRYWYPNAIITGPSLAYVTGVPDTNKKSTHLHMDDFLNFCTANNCLPDVLGWHDLGNSNPRSQDYTGAGEADSSRNLYSQVKYVRDLSDYRVNQYEINEALNPDVHLISGVMVREFALAERAKSLGLILAGRSYWPLDPCPFDTTKFRQQGRLAGLINPMLNPSCGEYLGRRYAWWTQKAYAEMSGQFLNISPSVNADAVAAISSGGDTLKVLTGNYSATASQELHLVVRGLATPMVVNGVVNVSITRIPGTPDSLALAFDGLAPKYVSVRRYLVHGDSVVVDVAASQFKAGDALSIEVTQINPVSVVARGNFRTVELAIQSADIGDVVLVYPDTSTGILLPYREENTHLKNGVKVMAAPGYSPIIVADSVVVADTLIVFPENANEFTTFEGIELRAGPFTKVLAAVRGAGSIRDCTLKDVRTTNATSGTVTGILALDHAGEIRNCTLDMTSHAYGSGQTVVGMDLGDLGGNSSHVVNCSLNLRNGGACNSWGIRTSVSAAALVESTFVKAQTWGIAVDGTTTVQFCTVDSTYYQGIVGTGSLHTIQNCIATHVLHGSDAGIGGWDLRYCISPSGFTELGYHIGNVTEDPGYCGPNTYTVKVDSYANPANNPSSKQIGAFPAACVYGTLARNVSWNGTKPPLLVPGDVTIPVGKSLTLTNGAVVKCGPGDLHGSGNDAQATEIIVDQGTLSVSGPSAVHFTSGATPATSGSWQGIRALGGSSVSVDSAVVEYADIGFDLEGSASGSVKRALFRNNLTNDILCSAVGTSTGITLEQNRLEAAGSAGISLRGDTHSVTIKQSTILRSGSSGDGISLTYNDEFATPMITQNSITGFLAGAGISIEGGSPTITKNTISTCATGIKIVSTSFGTPLIGLQGDSQSDNIITGNTVGISSQYADCNPVIRENKIQSNSSGVVAKNGASPNVGESGQAKGNNWFSGNTNYCIWNRNVNGDPQISAKYNYFGVNCDTTQMPICWSGNVDISHWLCTAPAGFDGMIAMEALMDPSGRSIYAIAPNPAMNGTVLTLSVEQTEKDVQVDAFDLAGRHVREVAAGRFPVGLHQLSWDGRNHSGTPVSAGIYFFRVRVHGRSDEVARLLVLQKGGAR